MHSFIPRVVSLKTTENDENFLVTTSQGDDVFIKL